MWLRRLCVHFPIIPTDTSVFPFSILLQTSQATTPLFHLVSLVPILSFLLFEFFLLFYLFSYSIVLAAFSCLILDHSGCTYSYRGCGYIFFPYLAQLLLMLVDFYFKETVFAMWYEAQSLVVWEWFFFYLSVSHTYAVIELWGCGAMVKQMYHSPAQSPHDHIIVVYFIYA